MSAPAGYPGGGGVDPIHAVLDRGLHQLAGLGGDLVGHANAIGTILWSPPRVLIVGRLKAGKSTLVNALIGAPVAETAALEATHVVTVYQDSAPSRAEVVGLDGHRRPVAVGRDGHSVALPLPSPQIAFVDRWLPSAALRDLTLIDTPGLSTLTVDNDSATRRAVIDGFEQTRTASVDADAAVFLFDAAPRTDELDFLQQLPFTPLTMLGVLSRADSFGEGALGARDPLAHASEHAQRLATQLAGTVSTVVPVSGLLAQTAYTGQLTEQTAAALATLRGLTPRQVARIIDNDQLAATLAPPARAQLLGLVGEYGLIHGREAAGHGAAVLNDWLATRCGIEGLRHLLHTSIARYAVLHRAHRILARLDQLAFTHPARDHIRTIAAGLRSEPALQLVTVLEDYQRMLRTDPDCPVTDELHTILTATDRAGQVELPEHSDPTQIAAAAHQRLAMAQQRSLATGSAAEDAALVTLIGIYTTLTTSGVGR
ncbi:GTPase [Gordonia tangerina]|uniref:50S ribosome-binding GTPase n=1 Tax=Gordonia tangerina TaxID=2911060 RepID=A0ABS9DS82_9ACTN|nr:GTPase [Gordonia tangerina]MCF3940668.1 50S ribosome-binding GTPase [Gordonia tangerina]